MWRGGVDPSDPQNFLLTFDQISEYQRSAEEYPLRNFHICRVCTSFHIALVVKIWMNLLNGLCSYVVYKLKGSGFPPNFQRPLTAKLCFIPPSIREARTCSRSSITMPSLVGLGFHPPTGWPKTLSFFCLSVCLSVCSSRF